MRIVAWVLLAVAVLGAIWFLFLRKKEPTACEKVVGTAQGLDKSGKIASVDKSDICNILGEVVKAGKEGSRQAANALVSTGIAGGVSNALGLGSHKDYSGYTCAEVKAAVAKDKYGTRNTFGLELQSRQRKGTCK